MRNIYFKELTAGLGLLLGVILAPTAMSQSVVRLGKGSIASFPPTYGLKQGADGGWNSQSTIMTGRQLWVDEMPAVFENGLDVPGRPIDTNNWWTDLLNSRYSGALWSYPAMVKTSERGVEICSPSYWADQGKEMKSKSSVTVGAFRYTAASAIAEDWHDWDVRFRMESAVGSGVLRATLAHGMPFTWVEFDGLRPELSFAARGVDTAVSTPYPEGTEPQVFGKIAGGIGIQFGDDLYAIYYPADAEPEYIADEKLFRFKQQTPWVVVGLISAKEDLTALESYSVSIPRSTSVAWRYDEKTSEISSDWTVLAENLRDAGERAPVMQGFLPHVYKYSGQVTPGFTSRSYATPRGEMKMSASESGKFSYTMRFPGMLPYYAAPVGGNSEANSFEPSVMDALMMDYAEKGTFGGDTYWGGKGLTQMALNMTFARQTGNEAVYEQSKRRLRDALVDWLTYTPGENGRFLSYFTRWGGILGFDVSYGSDTFNDHHFHFGYFAYAAALLCMEDEGFARDYGDVLKLIVKDYANWDKSDRRFPFMRTFDLWSGHSWAGGLGDAGNDNGNGQESSSESMQAWGGVYLLGVALNDREMRDTGIFGWTTEAFATREYWYDVDSPRPANEGGRKAWPGKNNRDGNYDYSLYRYAYNSNITGKGIGWWTWFGGDPLFMHGIQWMPISPALEYLSWDTDFVKWAFDDMMSGANSAFSHRWFENTENSDDGSRIDALATNDWGNVALSYLQRADPRQAAEIFGRAWRENYHIAKAVSTSHITYYTLHNTLSYGVPDPSFHADAPTAVVYNKDGQLTFMVYNPDQEERAVNFYDNRNTCRKSVVAAPRRLTVYNLGEPVPTSVTLAVDSIVPPGASVEVACSVLDQYGVTCHNAELSLSLSPGAPAEVRGNMLAINADAPLGTRLDVVASCGVLRARCRVEVNNKPVVVSAAIDGLGMLRGKRATTEVGSLISPVLSWIDQYGNRHVESDVLWEFSDSEGGTESFSGSCRATRVGVYTVKGVSADRKIEVSAEIFVMPQQPDMARGCRVEASSEENVGTKAENVNDGDFGTRWGSAHTDDEWIYVDLGTNKRITRVGVIWEAAYAAEYAIEVATKAGDWKQVTNVVLTQRPEGEHQTQVDVEGRYIRIRGIRRGTSFGYSIYEIRVYGTDANVSDSALAGVDMRLPVQSDQNVPLGLMPVAYSYSGDIMELPPIIWSADKDARFDGNTFTPTSHGLYTVIATVAGSNVTESNIFINESEHVAELHAGVTEMLLTAGETYQLELVAYSQFSTPIDVACEDMDVILELNGQETDARTCYDPSTGIFRADYPGDYLLKFVYDEATAMVLFHVKDIRDINLALGKYAKASSWRDANAASKVNDGDTGSRWESEWRDGESVMVDLGDSYVVDRFRILWEAASALEYHIDASTDGESWVEIYRDSESQGGDEQVHLDAPCQVRWLKLVCDRRKMPSYGVSIYEWEVFGDRPTDGVLRTEADSEVESCFTLQGLRTNRSPQGIYIRLSKGRAYKHIGD